MLLSRRSSSSRMSTTSPKCSLPNAGHLAVHRSRTRRRSCRRRPTSARAWSCANRSVMSGHELVEIAQRQCLHDGPLVREELVQRADRDARRARRSGRRHSVVARLPRSAPAHASSIRSTRLALRCWTGWRRSGVVLVTVTPNGTWGFYLAFPKAFALPHEPFVLLCNRNTPTSANYFRIFADKRRFMIHFLWSVSTSTLLSTASSPCARTGGAGTGADVVSADRYW